MIGRKLAIVDYDGVLADSSERFAMADASGYPNQGEEADAYWQIIFDPEKIADDRVIPNALNHLLKLQAEGWTIIFMTSIPFFCAGAVGNWLFEKLGWEDSRFDLVSKPNALQKNRTSTWKANMAQALSAVFDEVLFIDDEDKNIEAVLNHRQLSWRVGAGLKLTVAKSLEEVLALLKEQKEEARRVAELAAAKQEEIEPEDIEF